MTQSKVVATSEDHAGIAIIDGAGIVHRYAIPAGAKGWLTLRGSVTVGLFDEMVWETGEPSVVAMTTEELDGVQGKRVSFLPIPQERTIFPPYVPTPDDPRYEVGRYLAEEGGVSDGE